MAGFLRNGLKPDDVQRVRCSLLHSFFMPLTQPSAGRYIQTFLSPIILMAVLCTCLAYNVTTIHDNLAHPDCLPTYYQACKGASPRQSGIDLFVLSVSLGPASIMNGLSVTKTGKYHYQTYIGWSIIVIAMATLTTIHADTPLSRAICLPVLVGICTGMICSDGYYRYPRLFP